MQIRRLAFLSFGTILARAGGAAFGLLAQLLLAKLLPVDAMGYYFLAISLAGILGLVLTGGYAAIATTFLPRYQALASARLRQGFLTAARNSIVLYVAIAFFAAALVLMLAPLTADGRLAVAIGVLASSALCLTRMNNAIAISHNRFQLSFLPEQLLRPASFLFSILALYLLLGALSLGLVLCVYLTVALVVCAAQSSFLRQDSLVRPLEQDPTLARSNPWRSRAIAYLIVAAAITSFADILILMGGLLLSASELAVLGVTAKVAALMGFVTQTTQSFATPDLAKAMQQGRRQDGRSLLARAATVGLALNILAALGCFAGGGYILSFFGAQYVEGSSLLMALVVGQLLRGASGMNAQLLSINGDQKSVAVICAISMMTLFAMAMLVTPHYGLAGIAASIIVSDLVWLVLLAVVTRKRIGMAGDLFALLVRAGDQGAGQRGELISPRS